MTGPREQHHLGPKKPAREIFLTSSSLSFSSISSSSASSEDGVELSREASQTSRDEDHKGKHVKDSSRGSEMSCVTHVTMQPAPSPPSKFRPGSPYDPKRIPASVFGKKGDLNWSDDSLFSLRMSNYEAFPQGNEDDLMPLKVKSEDANEEITQKKKKKTSAETNMSSSPTPPPASYSYPTSFAQLYQAPPSNKVQSSSVPVVNETKSKKKRKKTRKNKKANNKEEKEKKNNKCCCMWSWLFSRLPSCKCYLSCCNKWRKCSCCCK